MRLAKRSGVEKPVFPTCSDAGPLNRLFLSLDGWRERFLEYVGSAVADGNPVASRWLGALQTLPEDVQGRVAFENVCIASGVPVSELTGIVVTAAMRLGHDAADLTANAFLPQVVHQLARSAKRIGGAYADIAQKDRTTFLQSRKFIPLPKGATTTIAVQANANAKAAAASAPSVPSFMEDMASLVHAKETVQGTLAPHSESEE